MHITKLKLEDMAGPVAAQDASPAAAVSIFLPRGKQVHGVTADAMFEGQQGVPLVWFAACASSSWLEPLQRSGCQELGSQDVEEQELCRKMHGRKDTLKTEAR